MICGIGVASTSAHSSHVGKTYNCDDICASADARDSSFVALETRAFAGPDLNASSCSEAMTGSCPSSLLGPTILHKFEEKGDRACLVAGFAAQSCLSL